MLIALLRSALAGADLPDDLDEESAAVAMIVTAARDLVQARRQRDASTAMGDMKAAKAWGTELAAAEDQIETHLRTL